ncbi:Mis12-domain-containing protein [Martensiomyces pterosporus]|nr:Mis12-domain-containing protein [Martensiomyces pterosporus]
MSESEQPSNAQLPIGAVPAATSTTVDTATDTAAIVAETGTEPMHVDEAPSTSLSTPIKKSKTEDLNQAILGATPGKHAEPHFKCVYPPSEKTQSLIVEHFGFLPISFIDEIINASNDTVYRATDALSRFVEKEQGSGEATSQAVNKAETLLEHAVDKNFDKFELYALRNLFNIPQGLEDYMVLPHQRHGSLTDTQNVLAEDEAALDKELEEVRRELVANNLLKTKLQSDISKVERGVRRVRALNEQLCVEEIARKELKGAAPESVAEVRVKMHEIAQLAERLDSVTDSNGGLSQLGGLNEPAARDIYLTRIADMQIASWEQRQAQLQQN